MTDPARSLPLSADPNRPMTTAGLQAKVTLRRAWFEVHPNQPMPEGRDEVERLFAAIEADAARASTPDPDIDISAGGDGWDPDSYGGVLPLAAPGDTPMTDARSLPLSAEALKGDVTALAHLTAEDWRKRRGADSIARTINAVRDIIDEHAARASTPTPDWPDDDRPSKEGSDDE